MRHLILLGIISVLAAGCADTRTTLLTIGDDTFNVYVADSAIEWEVGLGNVDILGEGEGMVFIFPWSEERTFWMKGVEYPIDLIWVSNSQVVGFVTAQPELTTTAEAYYQLYQSPEAVDTVIELSAGTVAEVDITVGDQIILSTQ